MSRSSKLSDRALDGSIQSSWQSLLTSSRLQRFIRRAMMFLGLTCAVALPLLNYEASEPLQGPPGNDGIDGKDGKDGRDGKDGKDGRNGSGTGANPSNITLLNRNELEILSAPPSKLWHRSVFNSIGDEFWGLPDSNIKLKLMELPNNGCNLQGCDATFDLTFDQYAGVSDSPYEVQLMTTRRAIRLRNKTEPTKPPPQSCKIIDDSTPYLLCRLQSSSPTSPANQDVCLWLRRATRSESPDEMVALEIRWEKIDTPNDRNCGGDFSRAIYQPNAG